MATPKVAASAFSAQPPSSSISASRTFKDREPDLRQAYQALVGGPARKLNQLHFEKPQIPVLAAFMKKANFRPWRSGACEATLYEFVSSLAVQHGKKSKRGEASWP